MPAEVFGESLIELAKPLTVTTDGGFMSDSTLAFRHYKVQRLRRLFQNKSYRYTEQRFVIEGVNLLQAALDANAEYESVFYDPDIKSHQQALQLLLRLQNRGVRCYELHPGVMDRIADCVTPQPICAIVVLHEYGLRLLKSLIDVPGDDRLSLGNGESEVIYLPGQNIATGVDQDKSRLRFLVACDINDPGNLGTLYRVADASSMTAVIVTKSSADPFSPKTIRSSAGSAFHIPIISGVDIGEVIDSCKMLGINLLATHVSQGIDYAAYQYSYPLAVIFGNESRGLDDSVIKDCDVAINIEISGRAESLNVAMAAAVICFEIRHSGSMTSKN